MRRKRVLSQKRPAAGGEARKRASFLLIEIASYDTKTLYRDAHCAPEKMAADAAAFQRGNVPRHIFFVQMETAASIFGLAAESKDMFDCQ